MINEIIAAAFQIIFFTLIPFFFFLVKNKTVKDFFEYIGIKESTKKANTLAIFASLLLAVPLLILTFNNDEFKEIMFDPKSITGKFRQMGLGINSIIILLVTSIV